MQKVKCTFCNGMGIIIDDAGTDACPCCRGVGKVEKEKLENFLEKEELANMEEE